MSVRRRAGERQVEGSTRRVARRTNFIRASLFSCSERGACDEESGRLEAHPDSELCVIRRVRVLGARLRPPLPRTLALARSLPSLPPHRHIPPTRQIVHRNLQIPLIVHHLQSQVHFAIMLQPNATLINLNRGLKPVNTSYE